MVFPVAECMSIEEKKTIALEREKELKAAIQEYLKTKDKLATGFDEQESAGLKKKLLLEYFHAGEKEWQDWHWQLAHRISDVTVLAKLFGLTMDQCMKIKKVARYYRWSVSPYYATLIDYHNECDPVRLQAVPAAEELDDNGYIDPVSEALTSPAPCVTRRYPDRLIINVTNMCATYCRHCQRRRNIGDVDRHSTQQEIMSALDYVKNNKEIRDVLITGGDALLLDDQKINWILEQLSKIKHVEIKRIGTRAIVTLPQRITAGLCSVLKKYPPIYINTQFNYPREVTPESKQACDMLIDAGVVLGNQAVLLKGVNNHPHIMKKLNQELLKIRVRPYYIFHAMPVKGTCHFITGIDEGLNIMEELRGYTSGLAVPHYIINVPHGYGKTPVLPKYVLGNDGETVRLRTWENRIVDYPYLPEKK